MSQESQLAEGDAQAGQGGWWIDGLRGVLFLRPLRPQAEVSPWALAGLVMLSLVLNVLAQRLMLDGPARFYWQASYGGWLPSLITLWLCWLVARTAGQGGASGGVQVPRASTLFAIVSVMALVVGMPMAVLAVLLVRFGTGTSVPYADWISWGIFLVSLGWPLLANVWLLGRQTRHWALRGVVLLGLVLGAALGVWGPRTVFWYPDPRGEQAAGAESEPEPLKLTQELMEAQSGALIQALDAIQPQRPGLIDLYAITFAPYAPEDVFSREVDMVSEVMRSRFDTGGRQIQLQNHDKTAGTMPWATPLNLERAIYRAAQRMDLDEDILFIYLTSHGARDGQLSAEFYPIEVGEVTPGQLKGWLAAAGIRYSVVSISACFSGSWIAPLSDPGMLVMTAADADHTSYGCGKKSPLTFFGRAVFDEQLRTSTRSFEAAHAAARKVIDEREKEAGKTDGYSNPQIAVGAEIRSRLAALEARLAAIP